MYRIGGKSYYNMVDPDEPNPECEIAQCTEGNEAIFGHQEALDDERMNFLYFELNKPLFVSTKTNNGEVEYRGRIFLHIYASGYLIIQFSCSVRSELSEKAINLTELIDNTKPWLERNNHIWSSRTGNDKLKNIVASFEKRVFSSIITDYPRRDCSSDWNSVICMYIHAYKYIDKQFIACASDPVDSDNPSTIIPILGTILDVKFVNSVAYIIQRPNSLRHWDEKLHEVSKFLLLWEFVIYKRQIYNDYCKYINDETLKLKSYRLDKRIKILNDDVFSFSKYDHRIPLFIKTLDDHIHNASGPQRHMYSMICDSLRFDKKRNRLKEQIVEWENEISLWENPILFALSKLLAPLKAILGK